MSDLWVFTIFTHREIMSPSRAVRHAFIMRTAGNQLFKTALTSSDVTIKIQYSIHSNQLFTFIAFHNTYCFKADVRQSPDQKCTGLRLYESSCIQFRFTFLTTPHLTAYGIIKYLWSLRLLNVFERVSSARQGCIYLFKVIYCDTLPFKTLFFSIVIYLKCLFFLFLWWQSWMFSIIPAANHVMLILF